MDDQSKEWLKFMLKVKALSLKALDNEDCKKRFNIEKEQLRKILHYLYKERFLYYNAVNQVYRIKE